MSKKSVTWVVAVMVFGGISLVQAGSQVKILPGQDEKPEAAMISVDVFNSKGNPIEGVKIRSVIAGEPKETACYAGNGEYKLKVPAAGRFDISFRSRGWHSQVLSDLHGGKGQRIRKTLIHESKRLSASSDFSRLAYNEVHGMSMMYEEVSPCTSLSRSPYLEFDW